MNEPLPPSLVAKARGAGAEASDYLRGRQSYDAGFCFYRCGWVDEPDSHDTYHAVAALSLLKENVPRAQELAEFLAGFPAAGVHQLYYRAFALELLGRAALIGPAQLGSIRAVAMVPPSALRDASSAWLQATLRAARLKRRFSGLQACPELVSFVGRLEREGGYGDKPNIIDTCICLSLLEILGHRSAVERTRAFVDRLQVPSLAFTSTSDSLSGSLDSIQAGLRCCAILGLPVRYAADALSFTFACRTSCGGFSRSPGALPDIEQTHRALQIISLLVSPAPA